MIKPISNCQVFEVFYSDGYRYIASATKRYGDQIYSIVIQEAKTGIAPCEEVYRVIANKVENIAKRYDPIMLNNQVDTLLEQIESLEVHIDEFNRRTG